MNNSGGVYIYMKTIKLTKKQYEVLRSCFQEGVCCRAANNDSDIELGFKTQKEINALKLITKNIRKKLQLGDY